MEIFLTKKAMFAFCFLFLSKLSRRFYQHFSTTQTRICLDQSVNHGKPFEMDFDLVMKNLMELNLIAGEGEHFVKHTKDGARLQVL